MSEWVIGLSSWIIQDGNYRDFARNERTAFALEFYPHDVQPGSPGRLGSGCIGPGRYRVNAEVIAVFDTSWVIDFGVCAFQQAAPPKVVAKGCYVAADVYLGIDPFFYFEDLSRVDGMPPLIYDWLVHKITIQTAPFIETRDAQGRLIRTRDETKSDYRDIDRTDAWNDDDGHAQYALHCALINPQPRTTRQ